MRYLKGAIVLWFVSGFLSFAFAATCVTNTQSDVNAQNTGSTGYPALGQSFTVASECDITDAILDIQNDGNDLTGSYTVEVEYDASGPSGVVLSSGTGDASALSSTPGPVDVSMSSATLEPYTQYWLTLSYPGTNSIFWRMSNTWSGGVISVYNGTTWSPDASFAFIFEIDGSGTPTSTPMVEATSSPDQVQQDYLGVYLIFFGAMIFVISLLRKRH